jgi:lipoprotein-releasing system permease protein
MFYELQLGLRYTRAGRSTKFISFISAMATAGIALGVAALIIVLSVMNGFQKEVRDRMLGVLSHLEVLAPGYESVDWTAAEAAMRTSAHVVSTAPFVVGQAMASRGDQLKGVLVRGIDPVQEPAVSPALRTLQAGLLTDLQPGEFGMVVGRELAGALGLRMGDAVMLTTADPGAGPMGVLPRMKSFRLVGIFSSGHYDYDASLIFIAIEDAARFFRSQSSQGLRARLDDMQQAPLASLQIQPALPSGLVVRDWTFENRNWFAAVQLEKRMMFVILMLIIAVAAFNLVSMLVMTVMDKRADIAILRTLGAQSRSIMAIFVVQGASLGFLGVFLGVVLGVLGALNIDSIVALVEQWFGFQVLPKGVYLIDRLPSDLRAEDLWSIVPAAFALSLLATLYPSWRASRLDPAEALRYD